MSDTNVKTVTTSDLFSALGVGGTTPKDTIKCVLADGSKVTVKLSCPVDSTSWADVAAAAAKGVIITSTSPIGTLAQKLVRKAAHKDARAITLLSHLVNGTSLDDTLTPAAVVSE
jgi:PP-loop superfamily ATP-utilizing enzyme